MFTNVSTKAFTKKITNYLIIFFFSHLLEILPLSYHAFWVLTSQVYISWRKIIHQIIFFLPTLSEFRHLNHIRGMSINELSYIWTQPGIWLSLSTITVDYTVAFNKHGMFKKPTFICSWKHWKRSLLEIDLWKYT